MAGFNYQFTRAMKIDLLAEWKAHFDAQGINSEIRPEGRNKYGQLLHALYIAYKPLKHGPLMLLGWNIKTKHTE